MTKTQGKKMEVPEMKMLRFSVGKARENRIRNKEVRTRTGVVELGQKFREMRLRRPGHIIREESYVGRRMRNLVVGRRRRGRPKRRWQDCINNDLRAIARKEEDALERKNGEGLSAPAIPTNGNEAIEEDLTEVPSIA